MLFVITQDCFPNLNWTASLRIFLPDDFCLSQFDDFSDGLKSNFYDVSEHFEIFDQFYL